MKVLRKAESLVRVWSWPAMSCSRLHHGSRQAFLHAWSRYNNMTNGRRYCHSYTHTHPRLTALCPGLPSRYQKGKTNLDFTETRDSEWQWNPLGHMQVCTWLQTDNHASTPPLSFLQAWCHSCRPTNSFKALKAKCHIYNGILTGNHMWPVEWLQH